MEVLNGLDQDAVDAKRLEHPQAEMIEQEWVSYYMYVQYKDYVSSLSCPYTYIMF